MGYQVNDYGASFQAWENDEFARRLGTQSEGLSHNQIACVVLFFFLGLKNIIRDF